MTFIFFDRTAFDQSKSLRARSSWPSGLQHTPDWSSVCFGKSKPVNGPPTSLCHVTWQKREINKAPGESFTCSHIYVFQSRITKHRQEFPIKPSVCWSFGRFRLTDLIQGRLNLCFAFSVQGWRGLVQQEDLGVANQGPSDGDPLLLSTTQLGPSVSNQGVEFLQHGKQGGIHVV